MKKEALAIVAALIVIVGALVLGERMGCPEGVRPDFARSSFTLVRAVDGKRYAFKAEVARTPCERGYGLMFLSSIPQDEGMIFVFDPPQKVSFWMENTKFPLDMIFVNSEGKIVRIAAEAKPHDRTSIPSGEKVQIVLEINGGLAKKYGIKEGDSVETPIFEGSEATP